MFSSIMCYQESHSRILILGKQYNTQFPMRTLSIDRGDRGGNLL